MHADRNLLFGILALQNDLVTRNQLVEAMNAWVLAKHRPLGDILRERGALDQPQHDLLAALVNMQAARHGGDVQRSLEALASASGARALLAQVADDDVQASLAHRGRLDFDPDATRQPPTAACAGDTGRYRILRPHARGGLGVVYVAQDTELHREVALKEMQDRHAANRDSRSRFVLEAEITGGLEHPGIVPVYSLGHHADGRPFYAMRFIRGDNLQAAITRFHRSTADFTDSSDESESASVHSADRFTSLAFRQLLRRFLDVCNAVAYAHSRGILHRDLKPGNIMLGKYGETLVVDWGLAKIVGRPGAQSVSAESTDLTLRPSSGSSEVETLAGAAVGTPAFMSPEQAAGQLDQLGPATDVYSLGATLYAVLTGKPPFEGDDVGEVLRRVRAGDTTRTDWQAVPRPLNAICQQAMALKPADRYATPLDLARDVEHWLADEPVSAYREPWTARTRRWMRRHRTFISSAAAVVLVGIVALAASLVVVTGLNRRLDAQNVALDQANADLQEALLRVTREKQRAETSAKAAQESEKDTQAAFRFMIDDLLAIARPEGERGGLGINVTVRRALDEASDHLAERFKGRPRAEAKARHELGVTYRLIGELARSETQLREAWRLRRQLLGPAHEDTLDTQNSLAVLLGSADKTDEAIALCIEVLNLETTMQGSSHPNTLMAMNNLAMMYQSAGRLSEALLLHEATVKLQKERLGPTHAYTLSAINNLALAYLDADRLTEALPLFEETRRHFHASPGPTHPSTLATMNNLAWTYDALGRHADALPLFEETLKARKAILGDDHPETLITAFNLGRLQLKLRNLEAAEGLLLTCQAATETPRPGLHPTIRREAVLALVRLYDAWDKPEEAAKWRRKLPPAARIQDRLECQNAWPLLWGWPRF